MNLIDVKTKDIMNIEIKPQDELKYDNEKEDYIIPNEDKNKVAHYWNKGGCGSKDWYKCDIVFHKYYICASGENVEEDTNMVDYFENIRQDIMYEIMEYKFDCIIDKYSSFFDEDKEYNYYQFIEIFETKESPQISIEDKQFVEEFKIFMTKDIKRCKELEKKRKENYVK